MQKIGGRNFKDESYKLYCPDCKQITLFTQWLDQEGGYLQGVICGHCGSDRQQKEPRCYTLHPYTEKCVCGEEITLLTQEDNFPEYHTEVRVICPKCSELILFNLPVN